MDARGRYFLPAGYRENPPASADDGGGMFWGEEPSAADLAYQDPVYRWAARLVRRERLTPVVDVGCGTGYKLVTRIGKVTDDFVGVDQESGIARARAQHPEAAFISGDLGDDALWAGLADRRPGLVLCADVVEHVLEPDRLVARLAALVAGTPGRVLISTPDRSRMEKAPPMGPPTNPLHIREWAPDELRSLLEDAGLTVVEERHLLPRRYRITRNEAMRFQRRLRQRRPVPDPRSCMAFQAVARRA